MSLSRLCAALVFVAVAAVPLQAQTFGEITGTVTDPTGAVIAGASVTITNVGTNQVRQVTTNDTGNYTAPFLVPGTYEIRAERPGFKLATRKGVELQVNAVARIDFSLTVGGITEVIEVLGGTPLLTTENASLGAVIENQRIVELPLNGRNYLQLVALTVNVTHEMGGGGRAGERQGGDRVNQPISIAGQRQHFNRFTLDGVENTDVANNAFVVRPSIDALQEFKVQTGVYSAEYGRAASQVNATTKPGSNQFHGTVFEFLRNDKLDAREWRQEGDKNPFRRNQFGFTLGGRLIRDKVFFLSNFEALRDRKTLQGTANVATDRMRAGDFTASGRQVYDPLSRVFTTDASGNQRAVSATLFPGNIIPQSRFHPTSQKLLEFYPRATVPGDNILRDFVRQRPRPISWEQFTQRIDFNESNKSSWFGRLSWGDEYVGEVASFAVQEGRVTTKLYQTILNNTRTFSPTMVNEFRFGYNQFHNGRLNHFSGLRDVTHELNITGLAEARKAAWGTPEIGLGNGLTGFGDDALVPFEDHNHTFQWIDNMSIIRGKHSIKFGGEIRRDRYNQIGNQYERGSFGFSDLSTFDPARRGSTGFGFASFLLGQVNTAARSLGTANVLFRATSFSLYTEDTWKITPRLTMNIGLRYENTPPYHDKYRGIMNVQLFDPGVGPNGLLPNTKVPIYTRPGKGDFYEGITDFRYHDGIPTQVGDQFLGRSLIARDNNDFAPRLGFSYSPTGRWTVRTGVGAFYTQDIADVRFDMGRNLGGRSDFNANQETANSLIDDPWKFERQTYQCANWAGTCFGPPFVLGNDSRRRTPYTFQWLFNVQRQLSENVVLEVGYQGNAAHKLERVRYYNDALNRTGTDDARTQAQRRPWPAYGRIQEVDGTANSNYHALSTKVQQRFSKGLTYLLGFTWSKAIDEVSGIRESPGERRAVDNYNLRPERGLAQFHTGRRLVASVLYELPFAKAFGRGPGPVNQILAGWQVGSILTFSDGTPINISGIGDLRDIGNTNFPDSTGISPVPDILSVDGFWNIAAFNSANPDLRFRAGNIGRNILLTPGVRQWDFSLDKNIRIREGHTLQFRFEAFNFSNHPNWNPPATDPRAPATFGHVTAARTMREMQFGLKYAF